MNEKKVRTSELFDCEVPYLKRLFEENEYPWQMLSKIGLQSIKVRFLPAKMAYENYLSGRKLDIALIKL